jgi:hypothetical protein
MARLYSLRGISKDRVYTFKMAARTVGVSEATFRKWPAQGLKVITDQRPYLVRGADLLEYLKNRQMANKRPMAKTQFFCMRCKAPRHASGDGINYLPTTELTGRLSGNCAVCGARIGRFCKASDLEELAENQAIRRNTRVEA